MQKLEVAMKYIERIADGKNPVNNKPTEEDSVLNNPNVVMPVLMNHYVMLQRNLIYTGITRAKKILVMVGTKKALSYAVRNVTVTKRNTLLKERLAGEIQARKPVKVYYPDFGNQAADVQMVAEGKAFYGNPSGTY